MNPCLLSLRTLAASLSLLIALGMLPSPAAAQEQRPAQPTTTTVTTGVPRAECFPLETLPAELRPRAEALLLKLLDGEGLYTLVGGLKPMSSGIASYQINIKKPVLKEVEEARRILATFRCGDAFYADVLPYHQVYAEKRSLEAVIFHRPTVEKAVRTYEAFFAPFGIGPAAHPMAIALQLENDPSSARVRGLGYLFGYPQHAVDFFATASEKQAKSGKLVPRDFFQIPTFASPTGRFVYAVPKGYKEAEVDRQLRLRAQSILTAYKERRARYIGEGKPGVVALLRDWMDDGTGHCSPENARF